jgi:hypothetical protein
MDMMIDIETLALTPKAVVLSVGAVAFEKNGEIVDRFYRVLNTKDQINIMKREVDPSTQLWWKYQDINAYQEAFNPVRQHITKVLLDLFKFISEYNPVRVWANSPSFDLIILESLYRDSGYPNPWIYKQPRDVRTIVDIANLSIKELEIKSIGIPHTPVFDCEVQIEYVTAARKKLGIIP